MKLQVFSVKDRAVGAYLAPFYARSEGEALRSFATVLRDPNHAFSQSPRDYLLYSLGTYDDASGTFDLEDAPRFVTSAELVLNQLELPLERRAAE